VVGTLELANKFPFKSAHTHGDLDHHLIRTIWFLGLTWVSPQMASRSIQPFLYSSTMCQTHTHRQTGTQTYRPYYMWHCRKGRIYALHAGNAA